VRSDTTGAAFDSRRFDSLPPPTQPLADDRAAHVCYFARGVVCCLCVLTGVAVVATAASASNAIATHTTTQHTSSTTRNLALVNSRHVQTNILHLLPNRHRPARDTAARRNSVSRSAPMPIPTLRWVYRPSMHVVLAPALLPTILIIILR
jgi:hypothetical protein